MPQSGYDVIAGEYYDPRHITSRNFDRTTAFALKERKLDSRVGLILEIGAGRGRSGEFLGVTPNRVVQLDSSEEMLNLPDREPCLLKIHADACAIPLASGQFAAVVGFLADPFFGLDSLAEARRVLDDGGELLITLPTYQWGEPLRRRLGIDVLTTRFKVIGEETVVRLPSVLHPKERIMEMLSVVGFKGIDITDAALPEGEKPVSDDITAVLTELRLKRHDLPLIHVVRAIK
jgi:SAM-dependent methyltransferase